MSISELSNSAQGNLLLEVKKISFECEALFTLIDEIRPPTETYALKLKELAQRISSFQGIAPSLNPAIVNELHDQLEKIGKLLRQLPENENVEKYSNAYGTEFSFGDLSMEDQALAATLSDKPEALCVEILEKCPDAADRMAFIHFKLHLMQIERQSAALALEFEPAEDELEEEIDAPEGNQLQAMGRLISLSLKDIFLPTIFRSDVKTQHVLWQILDKWIETALPSLLSTVSSDEPSGPTPEVVVDIVRQLKEFLQAYSQGTNPNSPIFNGYREGDQEEILGKLSHQLIQLLSAQGTEIPAELVGTLNDHLPKIMSQLIDCMISPDFTATLLRGLAEDETLAEDSTEFSSVTQKGDPIPPELQAELAEVIKSLLDLSHPTWSAKLAAYFVRTVINQSIDPSRMTKALIKIFQLFGKGFSLISLRKLFPSGSRVATSVDAAQLAPHLAQKYLWGEEGELQAGLSSEEREELPERLYQRLMGMAREQGRLASLFVTATSYGMPSLHQGVKALVNNLFELSQNGNLMRRLIINYLIQGAVIPHLATLIPEAPLALTLPSEVSKAQQQAAGVAKSYLRDYIAGRVLNVDSPLNATIVDFCCDAIERYLPAALGQAESAPHSMTKSQQVAHCETHRSLAHFLNDYSEAVQLVKKDSSFSLWTPKQREQHLLQALNHVRQGRGEMAISLDPRDLQKRLEGLTELIINKATQGFSSTQQGIARQMQTLLPKVMMVLLDLILSPEMMGSSLMGFLQSTDSIQIELQANFPPKEWEKGNVKDWNLVCLELARGVLGLLELDPEASNMQKLIFSVLPQAESQAPSLVQGLLQIMSSNLFAPMKSDSLLKTIGSILWHQDDNDNTVMSIDEVFTLDVHQKRELRKRVEAGMQQWMERVFTSEGLLGKASGAVSWLKDEKTPIHKASAHLSENLTTLLFSPTLLKALVFNYLVTDLAPLYLEDAPGGAQDYQMPVTFALEMKGKKWELPSKEPTSARELLDLDSLLQSQESERKAPTPLRLAELCSDTSNLTLLLSTLANWKAQGLITDKREAALLASLDTTEAFLEETYALILDFPCLSNKEKTDLKKLAEANDLAAVYSYLELRMHREFLAIVPLFSTEKVSLGKAQPQQEVEMEIQEWVLKLQKKYPHLFGSVYPELLKAIQIEELSDAPDRIEEIFKLLLNHLIADPIIAKQDGEFLKTMRQGFEKASDKMVYLTHLFSTIKQADYWEGILVQVHQLLPQEQAAFYHSFKDVAARIVGLLPDAKLRAIMKAHLKEPLTDSLYGSAPRPGEMTTQPYEVVVFKDSVEANQEKLQLIANAKHCVAFSGCYCGGAIFDQALDLLEKKMTVNSEFKVYILASDFMLNGSNHAKLKGLREKFPTQFVGIVTPEMVGSSNPLLDSFGLTTNHVKALVIDGGTDLIIGGSGFEDRWAYKRGTEPIETKNGSFMPLSFRDMDFMVSSPDVEKGIGRTLHIELMSLCGKWEGGTPITAVTGPLDPKFTEACPVIEPKETKAPNADLAFFVSGPDQSENKFHQEMIASIKDARKSITISHMYFHPSKEILDALIEASNRGVDITILTNQSKANSPGTHQMFTELSKSYWKKLFQGQKKSNIKIYLFNVDHTTMHKKVVIIDQKRVLTGSSNLGMKSMASHIDYEFDLIIDEETTAQRTALVVDEDKTYCELVEDDEAYVDYISTQLIGQCGELFAGFL